MNNNIRIPLSIVEGSNDLFQLKRRFNAQETESDVCVDTKIMNRQLWGGGSNSAGYYRLCDKNGNWIAQIYNYWEANGKARCILQPRCASGSTALGIEINADGSTASWTCTPPADSNGLNIATTGWARNTFPVKQIGGILNSDNSSKPGTICAIQGGVCYCGSWSDTKLPAGGSWVIMLICLKTGQVAHWPITGGANVLHSFITTDFSGFAWRIQ